MRRCRMNSRDIVLSITQLLLFCIISTVTAVAALQGDVNLDGVVDASDVQLVINAALGVDIGDLNADINGDEIINAVDVQLVINIALGIEVPTDGQMIYVSSSEGSDDNDGLTESTPKKTITAAKELLNDGSPDSLLLKRGDAWVDESLGSWTKSGASESAPMLIASYGQPGAPRPRVTVDPAFRIFRLIPANNITVRNIDFGEAKVQILGFAENIRFEYCYASDGIGAIQAFDGPVSNITFYRCIIVDSYNAVGGHAQGVFFKGINGILIEECILDHNGWNEDVRGADPTIFNHNIYIQNDCSGSVVRGNILARASSHGVQARSGGDVTDNLCVRNPLSILWSGRHPGEITGNVVLDGNDIGDLGRGFGIQAQNARAEVGATVSNNIVANYASAKEGGSAIELIGSIGDGFFNGIAENNIAYDWRRPLRIHGRAELDLSGVIVRNNIFQEFAGTQKPIIQMDSFASGHITFSGNTYYSIHEDRYWFDVDGDLTYDQWVALTGETDSVVEQVQFLDSTRTVETYHESLGKEGTLEAFLTEARKQTIDDWRYEYTAAAVIEYIQEGFTPVK